MKSIIAPSYDLLMEPLVRPRPAARRPMDLAWRAPALSKSAGCQCCGSSTESICSACTAALPAAMKLMDSTQGRWILNNTPCCGSPSCFNGGCTGQSCFNDPNFQGQGAADCTNSGVLSTITTCVGYFINCLASATPNKIAISVVYYWCCDNSALSTPQDPNGGGIGCGAFTGTGQLSLPLDCSLNSGPLLFTIPANPASVIYPNGATLTLAKQ